MRKILFGALVASTFFMSCSSDDDSSSSNPLTGKWYATTITIGQATFPYDDHEECGKDYIEFSGTNKVVFVDVWDCEEYKDEGTYKTSGNQLTISMYGDSVTAEYNISGNILSISSTYDYDGDGKKELVIEKFQK